VATLAARNANTAMVVGFGRSLESGGRFYVGFSRREDVFTINLFLKKSV
jgi:hypothetical protein